MLVLPVVKATEVVEDIKVAVGITTVAEKEVAVEAGGRIHTSVVIHLSNGGSSQRKINKKSMMAEPSPPNNELKSYSKAIPLKDTSFHR
jgi:hypothetical protein